MNFINLEKAETAFDLNDRFKLIFNLFGVNNIDDFNESICKIKNKAKIECNLKKLGININKSSKKIMDGVNMLRLKNNPIKINGDDILKIILNKNLS